MGAASPGPSGRHVVGAVFTLIESAILVLVTGLALTTPHSTCHITSGHRICGGGSLPAELLIPLACAIALFAVGMAVSLGASWGTRAAFAVDAVLTIAALAGLVLTYVSASPDDRSTYRVEWVLGLILIAPLLLATGLLWPLRLPRRHRD